MPDSYARELASAVAEIENGATVGLGGYFQHRHPMAAVRELIRQNKRDLHVVAPLGGIECDLLIGAGALRKLTFGFVSMDVYGQAPNFRKAAESGQLEVVEHGDLALMRALEAAERGVAWLPSRAWLGSDMEPHHPGAPVDMGNGERLWKVPALELDWALVHAQSATPQGDCVLQGESYDAVMIKGAKHALVTTEEIATSNDIIDKWNGRTVARYFVDAVVHVPFGAHPTSCYPDYTQDALHLVEYVETASAGRVAEYVNGYVGADEAAYQEAIGADRRRQLRSRMQLARRVARKFRQAR